MFLGIEIGGTKLQLGLGDGRSGSLAALERLDVDANAGAQGILGQIEQSGRRLLGSYEVSAICIGFGGPVDSTAGRVTVSHQISGWKDFPLVEWCQEKFGIATVLHNDCDAAAVAEATLGAGRSHRVAFFVTVGTGVGGGLVIDDCLYDSEHSAAAEIGHLRPGLDADRADRTIESLASGRGIESALRARLADGEIDQWHTSKGPIDSDDRLDLLSRCAGRPEDLSAREIAEAAADGNLAALEVLHRATRALGWGIAQVITLLSPGVVVIGGGVSLIGERLFFEPIRTAVAEYVFPPLEGSYSIVPAELGEEVVVHGALALAASSALGSTGPSQ